MDPEDPDSRPLQLPPMPPPSFCASKMEVRLDDTRDIIKRRLAVHAAEAAPVEAFYRAGGLLLNVPVVAGVKPTTRSLLQRLLDKATAPPPQQPQQKGGAGRGGAVNGAYANAGGGGIPLSHHPAVVAHVLGPVEDDTAPEVVTCGLRAQVDEEQEPLQRVQRAVR